MNYIWQPLLESDISAVDTIAREIHPTLPERGDVLAEKVRLFPQGCFKYIVDDRVVGYALSHPWKTQMIPPLDDFLHEVPEDADCIYVHDVAVLPEARGHNAAREFVKLISTLATEMQLSHLACVSVYGTDVLWTRFGFQVVADQEIQHKLVTYGESAKYMIANLEE